VSRLVFETHEMKPFQVSVRMNVCTGAIPESSIPQTPSLIAEPDERSLEMAYGQMGCLRGALWALAIQAGAGLVICGLWALCRFLL
jgi:hypothetical protein